jgi:hypothetical protein
MIPRYDVYTTGSNPDPDGAWVRYEDHVAALAEVERARDELRHPNSTLARCCSWCLQPYTDITTLRPTMEDNERIKADARQHFLTCSAHPAVAVKEQAEAALAALRAERDAYADVQRQALTAWALEFQPGGKFAKASSLQLGDSIIVEGGRWLVDQLAVMTQERDGLRVSAHGLALVEAVVGRRGMTDHSTPVHIRVRNVLAEADHASALQSALAAREADVRALRCALSRASNSLRTVGDDYPGSSCHDYCHRAADDADTVLLTSRTAPPEAHDTLHDPQAIRAALEDTLP